MSSRQGSLEAKCLQHPDCMEGPRGASTHTLPLPTGVGAQQVPGEQWPACNSSSPRSGGDALRGQRAHVILRLSGGDTQPVPRPALPGRGWVSEARGHESGHSGASLWSREVSSSQCPVSPGNPVAVGGFPDLTRHTWLATKPSGGPSQRERPDK